MAQYYRSSHLFSLALRIASRSRQRDAPASLADLSHAKKERNRGDRVTASLNRMPGIEVLVRDIRDGLTSPLVPCSLKRYRSRKDKNNSSKSTQLTFHAQFEKRGIPHRNEGLN